jgi:hypothetical protein
MLFTRERKSHLRRKGRENQVTNNFFLNQPSKPQSPRGTFEDRYLIETLCLRLLQLVKMNRIAIISGVIYVLSDALLYTCLIEVP